jgi:hypothetical protein
MTSPRPSSPRARAFIWGSRAVLMPRTLLALLAMLLTVTSAHAGRKGTPRRPAPPPAVPVTNTEEQDPAFFPLHQKPMKYQQNERSGWWSHRLDDGTWCKGKATKGQGRRP